MTNAPKDDIALLWGVRIFMVAMFVVLSIFVRNAWRRNKGIVKD
jgi:hypothetical protein